MRNEKGQAIVLYAISLVGLLGMGGVGVDLGYLYAGQAALQAAVDAGALGGASGLPDTATAQGRAVQIGGVNKVFQQPVNLDPATSSSTIEFGTYSSGAFTVTSSGINALRVTGRVNLPLFFAPVVGINTATITAQAVAVRRAPITCGAIFTQEELELEHDVITDSYNSSQGPYNPATAGSNGGICSNGELELEDNITVNGDATPGPGEEVDMQGSVTVTGSTTPMTEERPMPTIVEGDAATNNNNASIGLPTSPTPDLTLSGSQTLTMQSGTYYLRKLKISGNAALFINPTSGPVIIYLTDAMDVSGQGIINQSLIPSNLRILVTGAGEDEDGDGEFELEFDNSSSTFYGVILAPNAKVEVEHNVDFYGAIIAREFEGEHNVNFHYDEAMDLVDFSPQIMNDGSSASAFLGA